MLGLILSLLFVAVGTAVLIAIGTAVLQGYVYSEPVEGITWRSAAAGGILGLFFAVWCGLEAAAPGRYDSFFNFSPRDTVVFDQLWSVRKNDRGTQEILYKRTRDARGAIVYEDSDLRRWQRSDNGMMIAIIVEEKGERKRFDAELNPDGTFRVVEGRPLRYVELGGTRFMTETALGQITTTRYGLLIGNLLWNAAHLLVWFACLWLLMRFQWPHALGLAVVLWLVFVLTVWPVLQERVRIATAA